MAFLSDDFYKNLSDNYAERMKSTPGALAEQEKNQTNPVTAVAQPFIDAFNPYKNYFKMAEQPPQTPGVPKSEGGFKISPSPYATPETPVRTQPDISEAAQIKKFGGVVGSAEYLIKKSEHPYLNFLPQQLGSSFGMKFPDMYTWDKMTFADKASHVGEQTVEAGAKMVLGLPEFVLKSIPSFATGVVRPVVEGTLSLEKLAKSEEEKPIFVSDPIWSAGYEQYKVAKDLGWNDSVATAWGYLQAGANFVIRGSVGIGLKTAVQSLAKPPKRLAPGETVAQTAPIQEALTKSKEKLAKEAGVAPKDGPASIYLSHDTTTESFLRDNYKVSGGRIFTRITPAGAGKVEISVVQIQGPIQAGVSWVKKKISIADQEFVRGMKGPEKKLESTIVNVEAPKATEIAPKVTQPLAQEARKYKSAEEFVKNDLFAEKTGTIPKRTIFNTHTVTPVPLDNYGKYLYHETNLANAEGIIGEIGASGKQYPQTVYLSNTPELALGQGGKKGVTFIFDSKAVDGFEKKIQKPSAGFLVEQGKTDELIGKGFGSKSVVGIKVPPDFELKNFRRNADGSVNLVEGQLQRLGLDTKNPIILEDGSKVYTKSQLTDFYNTVTGDTSIKPFPDAPLKGFEDVPITRNQVENLSNIGRMNGIEPAVQDALVRIFTGKSVVGDLTNAEYINVAKNLSSANKLGEFSAGGAASLWTRYIGQRVSPAYSWVESVQRRTGVPMEDARIDLVNALRAQRTTQSAYQGKIAEIWGEYAKPKNIEYRRLIDAHRRGDSGAITNNPKLSPQIKSDLLRINDEISKFYEEISPALNVPKEIHRKNEAGYYEPDVPNIGGIIPKYKRDTRAEIGNVGEFAAKQKKEGGAFVFEDDAMKLMQGYARGGTYAKFVKPAVDRIKTDVEPKVPVDFKNFYASTINEMLGYQGGFEKFLDEFSNALNQKLNRNLPPDLGRRVNQASFSYFYVNALDSPGTWTRNLLTNEVLLLTQFGGENWFQVNAEVAKLVSGKSALWKEFKDSGFYNEAVGTYGADLGTVEGTVKSVAGALLKPQSISDNLGRFKAFVYTKLRFENAVKLYNEGKTTWAQAEKKLDLNGMSPIIANRVRGLLLTKDTKGAFEEMARNNINETNFPYGRGEGGRLTFGEAGHIATFLAKWNIHFTHNIGRWIRTGQFDKLIRYYTSSAAVVQSVQQATGFDFTRSVFLGPTTSTSWPPSIQLGMDLIQGMKKQSMDNSEAIDNNQDAIMRTVKTFVYPGGVDLKNWQAFWRSYSKGPVDAQGRFNIIGERGDVMEPQPVYFHDLFWRLMGMPTESKVEASKLKTDVTNYGYEVNQAKRKVAELRNAGKDDEANAIVDKWEAQGENIEPGNQSYDRFERSATERRFESLSPEGQVKFESRIYK